MPKFYDSIPPNLIDWALRQSMFFVASAPLTGCHVNLSPKGMLDSSLAILGGNEAAYVDITGSGCETISHVRENGRVTIMFCSFDAAPLILRWFCQGSVIEWHEPEFSRYLARMGAGKGVVGARAIIRLDIFKVQTSCGYAVPLLALTTEDGSSNGNGDEPKPKSHLKTRRTLQNSIRKKAEQGQLQAYHEQWNQKSLDGLPGLQSAQTHTSNNKLIWMGRLGVVIRGHRGIIEMIVLGLAVLWGVMC